MSQLKVREADSRIYRICMSGSRNKLERSQYADEVGTLVPRLVRHSPAVLQRRRDGVGHLSGGERVRFPGHVKGLLDRKVPVAVHLKRPPCTELRFDQVECALDTLGGRTGEQSLALPND